MSTPADTNFPLPPEQQAIRDKCFHPSGRFVEFPMDDVETSIPARFEKIERIYPDRLAVNTPNQSLTYRALNEKANRVARAILALRGEGNEPIALLFDQGAAMIVAILGVLKAGKIYVPLDPNYPDSRISFMLENSETSLIVSDNHSISHLNPLVQPKRLVLKIDEIGSSVSDENLGLSLAPETAAYIMYTSGSTGEPKGVIQNHRNVVHKVMTHTNDYHITAEDRLSLLYSYSFSASVRCIFGALLNGAAVVLFDVKMEGLARVADRMIQEKITLYFSVPTLFRDLVNFLNEIPSMRLIYLASESVSKNDVALFKEHFSTGCVLVNSLSSSETGTARQFFMNKETEMVHDIVPIGFAVRGHEVLLLDERIEEVGSDRIGEIAVRSRFLSPGYWRRPELTTAKFLPDPNGGDERIYLTGDLGRLDADGCLFHLGRKDNRIKIRGFTVEPFEVEQVLLRHPAVKEAAVVGRRSDSGEQHLVAYCVPALDAAPSTDELTRSMQATVPSYMVPSKFVMIDALPLTPNGKVDRLALPATDRFRPKLGNRYVAPKTFVEATLAAIWGTILSLEQIGVTDNFFDLGGHSLAASRVISRVIQTFQLELPLKALFDAPTVAEMAAIVEQNRANQANDAEIAQMLREVEAMSEEEAEKLLAGTTARRLQDDSHE